MHIVSPVGDPVFKYKRLWETLLIQSLCCIWSVLSSNHCPVSERMLCFQGEAEKCPGDLVGFPLASLTILSFLLASWCCCSNAARVTYRKRLGAVTHQFSYTIQPMGLKDPLLYWCWDNKFVPPCLAFYVDAGDLNSSPYPWTGST